MTFLSMKTVWLMMLSTYGVCTILVIMLWIQNRRRYAGTHLWAAGFACQTAGVLCIIMRNAIPDWLSIIAGNSSILTGATLVLIGLQLFHGKKGSYIPNAVLLAVFFVIEIYTTYPYPNMTLRSLNSTAGLLIIFIQCIRILTTRIDPAKRILAREVSIAFAGYALLSIVRIVHLAYTGSRNTDFFRSGVFETIIFTCYPLLFIMLTHSLSFMLNKRLMKEISTEKEKFSKAFHSAPFAIVLTRISDGRIFEINEKFLHVTGYSASEIEGKTMPELQIWESAADRKAMIENLITQGEVHGIEASFRTKTGQQITVIFSAEIVTIDGEEAILSTINDITERKQMEEKIRDISTRDSLTNIYNRRYILERLETIMAEHKRLMHTFTLAMIDLDRFKEVNDTYGHQAGDFILIDFTKTVAADIRPYDLFGRYGGEEFLVIFVNIEKSPAAAIMDRILNLARRKEVEFNTERISYTFSCGIADSTEFEKENLSAERMIEVIDRRLYAAKRAGRNRIVLKD
jgi:diguanylate cyclase (GGDEF)-like protein/PAS domain S-box-containing protein